MQRLSREQILQAIMQKSQTQVQQTQAPQTQAPQTQAPQILATSMFPTIEPVAQGTVAQGTVAQGPIIPLPIVAQGTDITPGEEAIAEPGPAEDKCPPPPKDVPPGTLQPYFLNNRVAFLSYVQNTLAPMFKTLPEAKSCDNLQQTTTAPHQNLIKNYLNITTPYRGLLLFHGLGTGKTGSSIGVAEGFKTWKQVVVLTPASLRRNYIEEIKRWGDPFYRVNNYWTPAVITAENKAEYQQRFINMLPTTYFVEGKKIFVADMERVDTPNFNQLNAEDRIALQQQIETMIKHKYMFLNYNNEKDLSQANLKKLNKQSPSGNFFDNKVVIIDEVQHFISPIVNALNRDNTVSLTHFKQSRAGFVYDLMITANNIRLVFLSGTPVVNYRNELAVLFNLLRGYIVTYSFSLQNTNETKQKRIEEWVKSTNGYIDYYKLTKANDKMTLTVSLNPYLFRNIVMPEKGVSIYKGTKLTQEERSLCVDDHDKVKEHIKENLKSFGYTDQDIVDQVENVYEALPKTLQAFTDMFIDVKEDAGSKRPIYSLKNKQTLQHRIVGLASFFENTNEDLMPVLNPLNLVQLDFSNYQFDYYVKQRLLEIEEDSKVKKKSSKKAQTEQAVAAQPNLLEMMQLDPNINKQMANGAYRSKSRLACNFAYPKEPLLGVSRPLCSEHASDAQMDGLTAAHVVEEDESFNAADAEAFSSIGSDEEVDSGDEDLFTGDGDSDEESGTDEEEDDIVSANSDEEDEDHMVSANSDENEDDEEDEEEHEENEEEHQEEEEDEEQPRAKSRRSTKRNLPTARASARKTRRVISSSESVIGDRPEPPKEEWTQQPRKHCKQLILQQLQLMNHYRNKFLGPATLKTYSPKFHKIIQTIKANPKEKHLVYSCFLTIEGITLFRLALLANGFAELKLKLVGKTYTIDEENMTQADWAKPKFMTHTTNSPLSPNVNELTKQELRNLFNVSKPEDWATLAPGIYKFYKQKFGAEALQHMTNNMGDIAQVMLITGSSAEGISLKAVCHVHIMEPYWHPVRQDQVIGRARRLCSHNMLPKEQQTVTVHLYLMKFSAEQLQRLRDTAYTKIMITDDNKTSDQHLYELSEAKRQLNKLMYETIESTAIDCTINHKTPGLQCFEKQVTNPEITFLYEPDYKADLTDEQRSKTVGQAIPVNIGPRRLFYYPATKTLVEGQGDTSKVLLPGRDIPQKTYDTVVAMAKR